VAGVAGWMMVRNGNGAEWERGGSERVFSIFDGLFEVLLGVCRGDGEYKSVLTNSGSATVCKGVHIRAIQHITDVRQNMRAVSM